LSQPPVQNSRQLTTDDWQLNSRLRILNSLSIIISSSPKSSHIATDGQSVSQSGSLGIEPQLWLMTRYLLLFDSYGLVFVGRGRVCLLYMLLLVFFWVRVPWYSRPYFTVSDLRLLFSSPSTTRRVTVKVFDSPPHGLLSAESESESYVTTDSQSASLSWYKAPIWAYDQIFIAVRNTEYAGQLRVC
jgi:hypothetical protein